jgi:acetyl esterase/lipase
MEAQWLLLGMAVAGTVLTVAALVPPNSLVTGNRAWYVCGWLAAESAPWLILLSAAALSACAVLTSALDNDPGRLAVLLNFACWLGLAVVVRRAHGARDVLETALRADLGRSYRNEIPAIRRTLLHDEAAPSPLPLPIVRRRADVEWIANLPYPGGHASHRLDVYRPAAGCHDAPVLVQIHGGDWQTGNNRRVAPPLALHLASRGWVVVVPNYRSSPGVRMPAQLVDCKCAFAWTRAHAARYGGAPSFIAVSGSGAGAQLATLLALTFDDLELQPGFEHVDTRPSACVSWHGAYDPGMPTAAHRAHQARLRGLGAPPRRSVTESAPSADRVSPMRHLRHDAPSFFVLHGAHDSLVPATEARHFTQRLRRVSGSPVVYAELPGAQHGWDALQSPRTEHSIRAVSRFLEWCAARHFHANGSQYDDATTRGCGRGDDHAAL